MTIYNNWSATPTVRQPGETGTWIVSYIDRNLGYGSIHTEVVFAVSAAHAAWEVGSSFREGWAESTALLEVRAAAEDEIPDLSQ